jgi:hypothetical protein
MHWFWSFTNPATPKIMTLSSTDTPFEIPIFIQLLSKMKHFKTKLKHITCKMNEKLPSLTSEWILLTYWKKSDAECRINGE